MHDHRYAKVLRTLEGPVHREPIHWTPERVQRELAKGLLPLARQQRRALEERHALEREARAIRSCDPLGAAAKARLARITARLEALKPPRSRDDRRAYRKRLAEELAELRRRAGRFDHDPEWAKLLGREILAERRAQLAERARG